MSEFEPYCLTRKNVGGDAGDWLVIRANDIDTLLALDAAAGTMSGALRENRGLYEAGALAAAAPVQAAPVQQYQEQPQFAAAPPQQYAPPAPSAAPAGVPAPNCQHGPRAWVTSKPGAPKQWKAWMCSAPQGTPKDQQCEPQWVR